MKTRFACLLATAVAAAFLSVGSHQFDAASTCATVEATPAVLTSEPLVTAAQVSEDPSVAEHDTWSCVGGSLARTRFTDTLGVLKGPLEMRFEIKPIGVIDAEPVYDSERLVTVSVDSSGKRQLEVFNIETGRPIGAPKALDSTDAIAPVMVDGQLVLRSSPALIEVYTVGKNGARRTRNIKAPAGGVFGHPILLGDDVIVPLGDTLVRYGSKGSKPLWTTPGAFRGHLTLVGTTVFGLEFDVSSGAMSVAKIDSATGSVSERRRVGRRQGGAPVLPGDDLVGVHGKFAMVFCEAKFTLETGVSTRSAAIDLGRAPDSSASPLTGSTFMAHPPAIFTRGWLGFYDHPIDGKSIVGMIATAPGQNPTQPTRLAALGWHEELLRFHQPLAFARSVTYFAGLAWDANTSRILWREPKLEGADLYPARESVLAIRNKKTIEVWRRVRAVEPDAEIVVAVRPAQEAEGLLLMRDGTEQTGKFELRGDGKSLEVMKVGDAASRGYRARECAFAGLLDGTVLFAADRESLAEGVERLKRETQRTVIERTCGLAVKSGDIALMSRVLLLANEYGASEKDLSTLEKALDKARSSDTKVVEKSVERTREELAKVITSGGEIAYRALESLWVEPPPRKPAPAEDAEEEESTDAFDGRFTADTTRRVPRHVYDLLANALSTDPANEAAREKLLQLLPEDVELPDGRRVVEWTKFAEANATYPVELHFPPVDYKHTLTWEQEVLDKASVWRKDITGFRTRRIFLITPVQAPGSVARCLSLAEELCTILESMFVGGDNERNTFDPLVIYLFGSREEYLQQSAPGLEWTAGYYNPPEKVSRLYVTDAGEEQWAEATEVLMHELTHHWIDVRNPRIPDDARTEATGVQKGYWIVEGFASLTQFFAPDPYTGTYTTENPRGDRADNVANARDNQLLPWKVLFRREHVNLLGLKGNSFDALPLTWSLGSLTTPGGVGLFYAQSAVVCMYLYHADHGALRGKLYDYVINYYTGNVDMLPIDVAFGMSEDELGRRSAEYARNLVKGGLTKR